MSMRLFVPTLVCLFLACNNAKDEKTVFKTIPFQYPSAWRDTTQVDTLYGKRILDPFRWLENGNAPTTREWMIQQQTLTERYLNQIPQRAALRKHLERLWSYRSCSPPVRKGNFYYVLQQERLQPQPVLYRMQNLQDTARQPVVNLNSLGVSGAQVLQRFALSQDGSLLAYEVAENGARWHTIFIRDMVSNRPLLDTLQGVHFSTIAWYRDGFFYSRYPQEQPTSATAPYEFQQVFYHRVGSPQTDDALIFADRSNPRINFTAQTTSDERFMILYAQRYSTGNALYIRDLRSETLDFTPIVEKDDAIFKVIENVDNNLLVYTNYKAPHYRLVQINVQRPEERFWETVIPESAQVLQSVHYYGNKLVAAYRSESANVLKIFDLRGRLQREIPVPGDGNITAWSGTVDDAQAFFTVQPFTKPPIVYALNVNDFGVTIYQTSVNKADSLSYNKKEIRYKSYDGTEIPLIILTKTGLQLDAARPTLLVTAIPDFPMVQTLLSENGVLAVAHVRGEAGRGDVWAQAGRKSKKQHTFDDFQAAAEYLIANNYTNPAKLAIYGKGDAGLTVGASVTQRPDLFQVAIAEAGILDLLRYQAHTIGWHWTEVYGTVDKPDEFDALVAYSPLHNVVPANYPATLVLTSNRNMEVVPAHSYKMVAELQQHQRGPEPVLLRIAQGGAYELRPEQVHKATDVLAFLFYHLQVK